MRGGLLLITFYLMDRGIEPRIGGDYLACGAWMAGCMDGWLDGWLAGGGWLAGWNG